MAETGHEEGARAAVWDYLKAHGRAGRKEIEQATGLSESAVRKALIALGREGLVVKIEQGPSEFHYLLAADTTPDGPEGARPRASTAPRQANATPDGPEGARPRAWTAPPEPRLLPLAPLLLILRLMVALASALYLAQELREALGLAPGPLQGLTPAAYLAFLGLVLGGRELAAWRRAGESFARFEAEIILAAWWLLDLGVVGLVNLGRPAWRVPPELWSLTWGSTLAIAAAKGSSALRRASRRAMSEDAEKGPGPSWAAAFTLLAAGALFGLFLFLPRPDAPPTPLPTPHKPPEPPANPAIPAAKAAPPRRANASPDGPEGARPQASTAPRRANATPDGPEGARPQAWTAPRRLRPQTPGPEGRLIAGFPGAKALFSCPGLSLKPIGIQDGDGEPAPAYEAREQDGLLYILRPRLGSIEIRGSGAGFGLAPAFGSSLPPPPGAPGRLEIGPNGPGCAGLWLYAGAYGSTSLFFALSRNIVRGVLLEERPWRDSVPGLRPDRPPAVLLWTISPADLGGREGIAAARVSEDASGCQSVSLVGPGLALAHRQDEVCGPRGRCARTFNKIVRRGDGWLWYQWWYDDAVGYPAMLAPAPDCAPVPADFRPI